MGCKASRGRTQCVGSSAFAMKEGELLMRWMGQSLIRRGWVCLKKEWDMPKEYNGQNDG